MKALNTRGFALAFAGAVLAFLYVLSRPDGQTLDAILIVTIWPASAAFLLSLAAMSIAVNIAGRESGVRLRRGLTGAALVAYAASGLCLGGTVFGAAKYLRHIVAILHEDIGRMENSWFWVIVLLAAAALAWLSYVCARSAYLAELAVAEPGPENSRIVKKKFVQLGVGLLLAVLGIILVANTIVIG